MSLLPPTHPEPATAVSAADRIRVVLEAVHRLLTANPTGTPGTSTALRDLARAFGARAAGWAAFLETMPVRKEWAADDGSESAPCQWPWEVWPNLLDPQRDPPPVRRLHLPGESDYLVATTDQPAGLRLFTWIEGSVDQGWTQAEQAGLCLAADAIGRVMATDSEAAQWRRAVQQRQRQRRVEEIMALTGRLAHDLSNMLTGVLGFGELALTQLPPGTRGRQHVQELYQTAQFGAHMVQRLSWFSKRKTSGPGCASLATTLVEEIARVKSLAGSAIVFEVDLAGAPGAVALDAGSLRQLLGSLLDNAREAIPGQGRVTVSARRACLTEHDCPSFMGRPAPGDCLELTIMDTGTGFPADIHERWLNDLFFTTKRGHRGMGLAVVYGILQTSGGGCRFEKRPGGGTTVRLMLPPAVVAPAPRPAAAGPVAPPGKREKLLVVDDDPHLLNQRRYPCRP